MPDAVLVCLVGTNPLPVCVSAIYFIEKINIKTVHLLCTTETTALANNVVDLLTKRFNLTELTAKVCTISSKSDPNEIQADVLRFSEEIKDCATIYLDYTGGTKAMCVHTAIQMLGCTENCVLVYQDSDNFSMLRDGGTALGSGAYDLREVVSLSLDEIIELHGYIKAESKKDDFDSEKVRKNCGDLVTKIMNLYEAGRLSEVYNSFKPLVKYLEKNYGAESEIKKCWKEEKKIDFNDFFQGVDNDTQKCLFDFISKIKSEANPFSTSDDNGVYRIGFKQVEKENLQECIDTVRFFCGFWLEMFCADVCEKILKGLRQKNNQSKNVGHERYELISNLRFKPAGGQENFEIDVLVRNGYMLTGISCSASGKKDCKLKGFEVIQRVRQLGGDESGAILFTLLSRLETKKLKDDLAFESQRGNKILVLGSKDMKKEVLEEKIKDFITG